MNGEKARGLVPPRPNLGPEPWREPDPSAWLALVAAVAAVALGLALRTWRRRRGARARAGHPDGGGTAPDPGPRGRLVDLSESIRDALTAQFGSSFRARTTEELSADERLAQLLGEEGFRELIQFLDRVDRIKFAPERPDEAEEDLARAVGEWEPLMTTMAARIRARPRGRTRPENGRPGRPP